MEHNFVQRLAAILPPDEFARFVLDSFEMPSLSGFFAPTCLWIDTATVKRIRREAREDFGMPTIIPERKFCISIPSPQRLLESLERQESAYPAACQSRDYLKFKSRLRVLAKYGME